VRRKGAGIAQPAVIAFDRLGGAGISCSCHIQWGRGAQRGLDAHTAWPSFQASDAVLTAALEGVTAGERVLRDAQLRVRALVEPLTEALLVQRDLQAARASLLSALAAQAIEKVVLEQETGITGSE